MLSLPHVKPWYVRDPGFAWAAWLDKVSRGQYYASHTAHKDRGISMFHRGFHYNAGSSSQIASPTPVSIIGFYILSDLFSDWQGSSHSVIYFKFMDLYMVNKKVPLAYQTWEICKCLTITNSTHPMSYNEDLDQPVNYRKQNMHSKELTSIHNNPQEAEGAWSCTYTGRLQLDDLTD